MRTDGIVEASAPGDAALPSSADPADGGLRLGYQPALDGIRGVGLIFVVVFHAGITVFPGSFLAVSVFFTLSGFLITRLLLEERTRSGTIRLRGFYGRRVRRLVPASSLTLFAVVALGAFDVFPEVVDLRRELVGAALQVSNWVRLTSGSSYVDLFKDGVSPVEHFWSLAIEEQFYLLWPIVFVAATRRSKAHAKRVVIGLFLAFGLAAPVIAAVWGPEATYLATPARISEILSGAALAMVFDWRSPPWWLQRGAIIAGLVVMALIVVTPFDHGWGYQGGLPLFSVLSSIVVAGALIDGPLRTFLSWRGFTALGSISYGVYLVHWPIYVIADTHWQALGTVGLVVAKFALTFAIAVAMFVVVEQPIRKGPVRERTIATWVGALAAVGVFAAIVIPGPIPVVEQASAAETSAVDLERTGPLPPLVEGGVQQRPVRILLVGDSTGSILGQALVRWAAERPDEVRVRDDSVLGCGLVPGGKADDLVDLTREECDEAIGTGIPTDLAERRPDLVVVSISGADTIARRWDDGPLLAPTDPEHAERIRAAYDAFFDEATEAGVPQVVWLRPPVFGAPGEGDDPTFANGAQQLVEDAVRGRVGSSGGTVSILDYRTWFEEQGYDARPVRPDGVHLVAEVADEIVATYLGPTLVAQALGR